MYCQLCVSADICMPALHQAARLNCQLQHEQLCDQRLQLRSAAMCRSVTITDLTLGLHTCIH